MCNLSIVVPVMNEAGSLEALDREIRDALAEFDRPAEIIYVDDGSTDGSWAILRQLCWAADSNLPTRAIKFRRNYGQTAAMAAGFDAATGEVIVPLDADGQNNPADIPRLVEQLERGFDVVSGWRRRRQDSFFRTLPARVANWLLAKASGVRLHDTGCTLKAYRAAMLKELPLIGEMHRFLPHYLTALGARISELPVDHRPRTAGQSKYGSRRIFKVLVDLAVLRYMLRYYHRPMHFFGQFALGFAAASVATLGLAVALMSGWTRLVGINAQAGILETPLPAVAACFAVGAGLSLMGGVLAEVSVRQNTSGAKLKPFRVEQSLDSRQQPAERRAA